MYEEEIHFGKLLLKQSETVLTYLTLVTLTFDPVIPKSINLLPRTDVLAKFEEGRSRRFRVIDRKRKGDRWTDQPTDMCKAICPLFFERGHNYILVYYGKRYTQYRMQLFLIMKFNNYKRPLKTVWSDCKRTIHVYKM